MTPHERAVEVVTVLREAGHEAYWVGGCVRDLLLGTEPKDYDVVTDAELAEIERLFPRHHVAGKRFGVVVADFPEGSVDIAKYRTEAGYSDRRRPDTVAWTDARGDVLRRDFTINGLLYDPLSEHVIDHVGGQRDLGLRLIRFIGEPVERVIEDPLRMLRAVRLKTQLDFQLDKPTFDAIRAHAGELAHISAERIQDELTRILAHPRRVAGLRDLDRTGLLAVILPELEALKGVPQPYQHHQEGDVFDHSLRSVETLAPDAPTFLVLAVLLHDVGKPRTLAYETAAGADKITTYHHAEVSAMVAEQILRRLKFPRTEIETVSWLIAHHMSLLRIDQMRPARREAYVLDPRFPWLLELHKADASGTVPRDLSLYAQDLKLYEKMKADHAQAKRTGPPLLVDGHVLGRELGLEPGPKIGELLEAIRDAQLAGQITTKDEAVAYARSRLA
ncbi:CCA tRNA nucleotidyltransferase [Candidatus Berkelbacteria bacterium]|nr:CCA tRNA nucleotidyltransferase [Candidatus Berkelbacteria bacterium]